MVIMAKVHVVGCGPAGSIAAISAIRSGHDVIISEEHEVSGRPENCSGLFSCDGLRSLSGFMDPRRFAIAPMRGAVIRMPGEELTVRRKEPVGFVCDRASMDQELAISAQAEGAKIMYGHRVDNSFESSNVIGADGPLSTVAAHFGFPKIRKFASTLQALLPYRSEEPDMVEVFLSNSRFPGFFGWMIPHDECTAEFGVGVEISGDVRGAWNALLKIKGVNTDAKPRGGGDTPAHQGKDRGKEKEVEHPPGWGCGWPGEGHHRRGGDIRRQLRRPGREACDRPAKIRDGMARPVLA